MPEELGIFQRLKNRGKVSVPEELGNVLEDEQGGSVAHTSRGGRKLSWVDLGQ